MTNSMRPPGIRKYSSFTSPYLHEASRVIGKPVEPNSRFFLIQQGDEGRGIVGQGDITSPVYIGPHWDREQARKGKKANYVEVKFTKLIDPFRNPEQRLDIQVLIREGFRRGIWGAQASGIELFNEEVRKIEALWTNQQSTQPPPTERIPDTRSPGALSGEGDPEKVFVKPPPRVGKDIPSSLTDEQSARVGVLGPWPQARPAAR